MTVREILDGEVKPDTGDRITAVPPPVLTELKEYIKTTVLTDTEADNFVKFFCRIHADMAVDLVRDNKVIQGDNMVKFADRNMFRKFIERVSLRRR